MRAALHHPDDAGHRTAPPSTLLPLILSLALCFAAAALGSALTLPSIPGWYESLAKPVFSPPNWVFGPVWTILYAMMALALWRVWIHGRGERRTAAVALFLVQLALNVLWSGVFFAFQAPASALIIILALLVAIVATMAAFGRIERLAAWLLVPYVGWVGFAALLNAAIWLLN